MNWLLLANCVLSGLCLGLLYFCYRMHEAMTEMSEACRVVLERYIDKWRYLQKKYPQDFERQECFDDLP